jgi:hypothetical protein
MTLALRTEMPQMTRGYKNPISLFFFFISTADFDDLYNLLLGLFVLSHYSRHLKKNRIYIFHAGRKSKMASTAIHRLTLEPMGKYSNAFFSEITNMIKAKLYMNVHYFPHMDLC